ncbi:hypothetical protein ACFOD1_09095 [Pseudidiomarina halophila]|uniref:Uncharacterized protein n=1 Tax=Pseudidiomarina halophila TaxID=1449799 RepID=A0A432Y1C1_9GAMM|nr:hypothetical protein [Pseudidiomarina halophila]RUO54748.1 hypothetical protein CWI69_04905 [Pseudidiomarina halophila]
MKKISITLLIFIMIISYSAKASELSSVTVDVQDGFNGQSVTIFANEIEFWHSKSAVSDFSLGFVDSFKFKLKNKTILQIQVIMDNKEYVKEINVQNDIYIGVERNVEKGIIISVTKVPFYYD